MSELAGWVAPIATMVAAIMTASNLGARVTGWGFVVFTVGSICWIVTAVATGQPNLLATNIFLTLVNVVGIWRWLGRQQRYESGSKSAERASRTSATPTLFSASSIAGMSVQAEGDPNLGKAVEALIECGSATISYVVVASSSGLEETLRAIPVERVSFDGEMLTLGMTRSQFDALPPLEEGQWPVSASSPGDNAASIERPSVEVDAPDQLEGTARRVQRPSAL